MAKVKNTDTLNFQIDKLSEAIESMMKGFETLQAPKTLDSDIIRVRPPNMMHVGLTGDDDLSDPDSFCKDYEYDPEKIGLYYDQACMIKEDFRSFELEKQENQEKIFEDLQFICNNVFEKYGIALASNGLQEFLDSIGQIVEKTIECSLVDLHGFLLFLCGIIQQESPGSAKFTLGDTVLNVNVRERPRKRFQKADYTAIYDETIEKLLNDKDLPEEIKNICRVKKNFLVSMDLSRIKNMDIDSLKEEYEQNLAEVESVKKKFLTQLDSLSKFSKQLRQKDIDLIKSSEQISIQKENLDQEKEKLSEISQKHAHVFREIKKKIFEICPDLSSSVELKPRSSVEVGRFSPLCIQVRTSTPVTQQSENNDEIAPLQAELSMLEGQPQDSSTILRINRLKTQISTIRTNMAINNSLRNSSGGISKSNQDHKRNFSNSSSGDYQASPLPRSGCSSPVVFDNSYNKRVAPKPPPIGPRRSVNKQKDGPDEIDIVRNHLKLQESRLKEKEDLLDEKEARLQRTWMRLPNSDDLIGIIHKEIAYLNILKKNYEDKYEELNAELITFAKKNNLIKAKERELDGKILDAGKEKKELEDEKNSLQQKFENVLNMLKGLL